MRALLLAGVAAFGWAGAAQAAFIATFTQDGSNVGVVGSGTIDITGLRYAGGYTAMSFIRPTQPLVQTGPSGMGDYYLTTITGPSNFGSGDQSTTLIATGDMVGFGIAFSGVFVPLNYISGSRLSSTSTYVNKTFADLGVTPGRYVYEINTGAHLDTFTIQIVPAVTAVPEPASLALLGLGLAGVAAVRRRKGLVAIAPRGFGPSVASILPRWRGRVMPTPNTITAVQLSRLVGLFDTPVILDGRTDDDHALDSRMLPGLPTASVRPRSISTADFGAIAASSAHST